jgi:Flp pilus assembly pilin Flp
MTNFLLKFLRDESGATAIEYGLIAAGISLAIIAVRIPIDVAQDSEMISPTIPI